MSVSPLITNNFIDSCAFNPHEPEGAAALELFALSEQRLLFLQIAHSTLEEIAHPNTPARVKTKAGGLVFSVNVQLTTDEQRVLADIERILAGDGSVANITQDARHVFEAQKYGSYFVTTDRRILKKASALHSRCGVSVLKPSQFLALVKQALQAQQGAPADGPASRARG